MNEQNSILKNPFGLNIKLPQKTIREVQKVAVQEFENLTANPFTNYLEENDKVFSGQVAAEIRKYQAQMYTLGQVMREGQTSSSLNIKM